MSKIIQTDDLSVGMIVTVFKGAVTYKQTGGLASLLVGTITEERDYGKGSVLKIEAIDIPYIITSNLKHPTLDNNTWDLRETKFARLSGDFIKTALIKK